MTKVPVRAYLSPASFIKLAQSYGRRFPWILLSIPIYSLL
jgi:hypothetical protein